MVAMAEISPMANGRFNRMPCSCCCGDGCRGRAAEKREWQAEAEDELAAEAEAVEQQSEWSATLTCEYCNRDGEYGRQIIFSDQGTALCVGRCYSMVSMLEETFPGAVLDLADPMIHLAVTES